MFLVISGSFSSDTTAVREKINDFNAECSTPMAFIKRQLISLKLLALFRKAPAVRSGIKLAESLHQRRSYSILKRLKNELKRIEKDAVARAADIMGTSVSHRSPDTGWEGGGGVFTHMRTSRPNGQATKIWRAATKGDASLAEQLGSQTVAACIDATRQAADLNAAAQSIRELNLTKENTIVGEFAKRAMMIKASGGHPK